MWTEGSDRECGLGVVTWSVSPAELEDSHHVLEEGGVVYNAVLGLVDIVRGTNSYYKLQLLEGDSARSYYVFRSWGRVGTSIGGTKLEVSSPLWSCDGVH